MWPTATDIVWSLCPSISLSVLAMTVSPAKMADLIKMPFGRWTRGVRGITYYWYMGLRSPREKKQLKAVQPDDIITVATCYNKECIASLCCVDIDVQELA